MGRSNTSRRGALPRPEIRADEETLTRFAGLIPVLLFATNVLRLPRLLREVVGEPGRRRTHPVHHVLMAFFVGALAGTERLAHLEWLRDDTVLLKYLRLGYWPVRKVFSLALAGLSDAAVLALELLVANVARPLHGTPSSVVIDFDNTALIDHGSAEGGRFGHCGKGRRRRRHYPLVASVAESCGVFMTKYRGGDALTAVEIIEFFQAVLHRAGTWFGQSCDVILRGDAGFAMRPVLRWLHEHSVSYVMAHPLSPALKTMLMTAQFTPHDEIGDPDEDIQCTVVDGEQIGAPAGSRIIVIRRRVNDPSAPPLGKTIDWSPHWRYQAIVTSQPWSAPDVWRFYNDRANCERIFRTGKQGLALGNLVGHSLRANEVAFLLRLLAYNVDLRFQHHARREAARTRRRVPEHGLLWRQRRFYLSPARLLREQSRWVLRVPRNAKLRELWQLYGPPTDLYVVREVTM